MPTILITGASAGFGHATAQLLAKHGYKLILTARRLDKLQALAQEIGENAFAHELDVTNQESVAELFADLPDDFRQINGLINNAGLAAGLDPADTSSISDWEQMVDTNIKGLLYMTRQVLPQMKEQGNGIIINIGSVAAHAPYKGGNVYGATKAFVSQFSRNLRADLFGTNIKITNIEPGMAETEFSVVRFYGDSDKAKQVYQGMQPLTATDIAETILWILQRPAHVNIDNIEIMPIA